VVHPNKGRKFNVMLEMSVDGKMFKDCGNNRRIKKIVY